MLEGDRDERAHWTGGGELLTVRALDALTKAERRAVPEGAARLLAEWPDRLAALPPDLAWAQDVLRSRTAVLERARFDDREYWTVRLTGWGDASSLAGPCLGGTGEAFGAGFPEPLGWLGSTFGTATLVAEQSGTAPFGRPLASFLANGELLVEQAPPGSDGWVALYECDGDAVFADLASGAAYWVGHEWTGEEVTELPIPWPAVAHFVLWRMLDGGWVRPSDLAMLAACAPRRGSA